MSQLKIAPMDFLIGLSSSDLSAAMESMDEPAYRGNQIFEWIYHHGVNSINEMHNLPLVLRDKIRDTWGIHPLEKIHITGSDKESTRKFLFQTPEGHKVESVLMRDGNRVTVCISSQVGCAVDCHFCATATMGFIKNLTVGEIVDQVLQLQSHSKKRITNVVFMGMGEPFLNYGRVIQAALLLNDGNGYNLGARRITLSTSGVVPKIRQFAEEGHPFKLAISLNGVNQNQREKIMPITKTHSLDKLIESAAYYYDKSHRMITFEYVLLKGINDSENDARALINLIGTLPCKVNLIPYNEIGGAYSRPADETVDQFLGALRNAPFTVTVRWSKGTDIDGGCGQLAVKN